MKKFGIKSIKEKFGTGKKRAALAGGALVLVGAIATAAAFTDFANLNLAGGAIGRPDRFDIAVVLPNNKVEQADTNNGYDWVISGSDSFVPGHEITTEVPIFNNTPKVESAVSIKIELLGNGGQVGTSPNITQFLRFTAEADGQALFSDVPWDQAQASLGKLAPRGDAALADGANYVAGASGSEKTVKLTIKYLDAPETVNFNGGQSALRLKIEGSSV